MRYHLFLHFSEDELAAKSSEWHEAAAAFFTRYSGELEQTSELDWHEAYAQESRGAVVRADASVRLGHFNAGATPIHRIWAVRVVNLARAQEIAAHLAAQLDTGVEVREVLEGAHRP